MLNVRIKGLQLRCKFMLLVLFCTFITPQLCLEIQDYESLGDEDSVMDSENELNFDRTRRVERDSVPDYIPIPTNEFENGNISCVDHFCYNISNYPIDGVNNAVKNIPSSTFVGLQGDPVVIENRLSPVDGKSLCDTISHTIYPERANNTNNKAVFIVNTKEKKQGIIIRKCTNVDNKNGGCGMATFPDGYVGECVQRYSQVHLLAYNNKGGADEALFDTFSIPSCCVCSFKKSKN